MVRSRAMVALAALAPLGWACGSAAPTGPSAVTVARLTVTPALDTAASIGQTVRFSAVATDRGGTDLQDVTVGWRSSDPSVATISSAGVATSVADGTTLVIASAGAVTDTARLVVRQRAVGLAVTPDTADVVGPGDTVRFSAHRVDALGHPVSGSVHLAWSVSASSVAAIDSSGLARTASSGITVVTARLATGLSGSSMLRVFAAGAVGVSGLLPLPLREGRDATILGTAFRPRVTDNVVVVDGAPATVLAAWPDSLRIRVPTFDCRPTRTADVQVSTPAGPPADTTVRVQGEGTVVSLDVGRRVLLQDPSTFCLQFDSAAGPDSYLVGVQAAAPTAGDLVANALTQVAVTAVADGSTVMAAVSGARRAIPVTRATALTADRHHSRGGDDDTGLPVGADSAWIAQAAGETRLSDWSRAHLDPAASLPARRAAASLAPGGRGDVRASLGSSGTAVGDTLTLRVPDGRAADPCTSYTQIRAVVRVVGAKAILLEDVANPSGGLTTAQYQSLSDQLDSRIMGTLVDYFGAPTDLDGNGRIAAVFTREVNRTWSGMAALVFAGDLFPRSASSGFSCPSSDEGEVYYSQAPDPTGLYGYPLTATDLRARAPVLMAHELTHVIQQGRRFAAGGPWMAAWMMEAQAVLAQEVAGHAVLGNAPGHDYGLQTAYGSDVDGTHWYREPFQGLPDYFGYEGTGSRLSYAPASCGWLMSDPSPCGGVPGWYTAGWSFLRWLSDRFGPALGGEPNLHRALVDDGVSGFANVQAVVGEPWQNLLADWAAALYVDGRVPGADPDVTFTSWDLQAIFDPYGTDTGLQPLDEGFSGWSVTEAVRSGSTAYFRLAGSGHPATAVRVRTTADADLPAGVQVWVVRLQ